jgi:hypothetical protein
LRFTLGEDVTAAFPPGPMEGVSPSEKARVFRLALDVAAAFKPLTSGERRKLLASSAGVEPLFKA